MNDGSSRLNGDGDLIVMAVARASRGAWLHGAALADVALAPIFLLLGDLQRAAA